MWSIDIEIVRYIVTETVGTNLPTQSSHRQNIQVEVFSLVAARIVEDVRDSEIEHTVNGV